MVPYLKGVHLTLDSWRPYQDDEGWQVTGMPKDILDYDPTNREPIHVKIAPRLRGDIEVLMIFSKSEIPLRTLVKPTHRYKAYMFGDASGQGFGLSLWSPKDGSIELNIGSWQDKVKENSSYFRESLNFVRKLETMVERGEIEHGSELWLFTDNFLFEACYSKGAARSKTLHELITRLRN